MIQEFQKGKITTWLLPVVLVLSLFTFTGINSSSAPKHHKTTTEQIDRLRQTARKSVSLKLDGSAELVRCRPWTEGNYAHLVFDHDRGVRVQMEHCTRQCLEFTVLHRQLPHRSFSADEDFISPQLG